MAKSRMETWLALIVLAIGGVVAAILGLWAYVGATATPLHPDPQRIPSAMRLTPCPKWADAVEKG